MITDTDIKKLKLERFLTKEDFKKASKNFATKEDIEKLDIKTGAGFLDVQNQINNINVTMDEMKSDIADIKDHMLTMEDNIVGAINSLRIENQITSTYKPRIEDHEQRITKVENVVFSN